jgi:GNAT superfamily N-acetyltransferase
MVKRLTFQSEAAQIFTIRPATEADLPALVAMMRAFEAYLNAIDPADASDLGDATRERVARFALGPPPCRTVLLAEGPGGPEGFIALQEIVWMDDGAPALWVSDLYVEPSSRGAGLGRDLIVAAQAEVAARGGRRLVFTVWDRNAAARAFYARLGAVPVKGEILLGLAAPVTQP